MTIKVVWLKTTFILTGCREYLYISVCIWYEDSFTQMKWWNAHEVTHRAVLEMLFVCLCPHWDVMHASVCVCVCVCVCVKGKHTSHKLYYQRMWAEHIAGSRSVKEISCTKACHTHSTAAGTGASTSTLTLHRHSFSARYLKYWTECHAVQWWRLR